jgi:glycosyltransferase involved in cell wall biosynthesis
VKIEEKNLAIFINAYLFKWDNNYYSDDNTVVFCLNIAKKFKRIIIFAPVLNGDISLADRFYKINGNNLKVIAIPNYNGSTYSLIYAGFKVMPALYKVLELLQDQIDILWQVDCPNPLNLVFNIFCSVRKIPMVFFLRLDVISILKIKNRGFKRFFSIIFAKIIDWFNRRLLEKHPAFVTGEKLYQSYKKKNRLVYKIFENLIRKEEILAASEARVRKNNGNLEIVGIGRLEKQKGFVYLLETVRLLTEVYCIKAHFTLIGSGPEEKTLKEYIHKYKLEDYVEMTGFIKHGELFSRYLEKADILAQPSLEEGVPKTIFEAMASGIPIIASRVGGLPYLIKNGVNGLLVKPANPEELAEAILRYKNDFALFKNIALNNLSYVDGFIFEKQRDFILETIKNL